jgi:hypothetical protein
MTDEEKQEVLSEIKAESLSLDELEQVETLDGVNSLPAIRGDEMVSAPLSLLQQPAEEAAQKATDAADYANSVAKTAAATATVAMQAAENAEELVNTAKEKMVDVTVALNDSSLVITEAEEATKDAKDAADAANSAAQIAKDDAADAVAKMNSKIAEAEESLSNVYDAKLQAISAATAANTAADNANEAAAKIDDINDALDEVKILSDEMSEATKNSNDAADAANAAATLANNGATSANAAAKQMDDKLAEAEAALQNVYDAKTRANEAANSANEAAVKANETAAKIEEINAAIKDCNNLSYEMTEATKNANDAADSANAAANRYTDAGVNGATERICAITEGATIATTSTETTGLDVYYDTERKLFYVTENAVNYRSFPEVSLYADDNYVPRRNKVFLCGDGIYVWSEEENDLVAASGAGTSGGNTINVSEDYPLERGFYTLLTAVKAVEEKRRYYGRCVTFESSTGKWTTKQFVGSSLDSWEQESSWEDFGGAGTMKSLTVNGKKQSPDSEGNVSLTIDQIEVDESLDSESTNPVQNSAITTRLNELEANTIYGADAELSDDETSVRLTYTNKSGAEVFSVDVPAGSGGSGESTSTKIVLSASVNKNTIKEGDSVLLTWTYDHQNTGGDEAGNSTGQKANVTIQVKRGTTTTYSATTQDVSKGTFTLDLSDYLLLGTSDIYVIAETTDPNTGKSQKKQVYLSIKSVTLSLSSSYNLASGLSSGGYASGDTVSIPYSVSGSGTKTVTLYMDGLQKDAHVVTRSGTTNSSFDVKMSGVSYGRHTFQMIAEMEAGDDLILKSESVYIDILKAGNSTSFVGLMFTNSDGRIFASDNHLTPTIEVGQYESCKFNFVAYNPNETPTSVKLYRDGELIQTVSVSRSTQTYQNRFVEQGTYTMAFVVGSTEYTYYINVVDSGIDIAETTYGLQVKLSPSGRSNEESNPAKWESNGVETTFEGFDWASNGWTGSSLKLTNGAKAVIDYNLFKTDAGITGMTIEMEFKVTNVLDRDAEVISCMDNGKGLSITTEDASIKTGTILHYTNEDGEDASREIKIGTKFASDQWLKVAFVIGKRSDGRLMELYVNGNRAGADIYDNSYYFQQDSPQGITINSDMADIEVKNIRIYNRALSDDEILENRMVDADSTDDMVQLYQENDILGETGDVDIDKLREMGKGIIRIVRKGGLDEVNETNNKKTDFNADVYFYSPFGKEFDFVLYDCYIRIQGTSSTKYPSKNIRIYFSKGGSNLSFEINGVAQSIKTYSMRENSIPMDLFCLKSDYSDSSMCLNTGGAKLFNDVMKELNLLTPPQRFQYEQAGGDMNAVTIRQSIDGFPIDVFSAETADGESTYYGQYNFNNEKSKSGKLFGMEGLTGFNPECPLVLEALNNTAKLCLYQSDSDADVAENFDAGLETNYPDDVKWAGLDTAQQTAVKQLFAWIRSCVPAGATSDDLSTFVSQKFVDEIDQHFDKDHLLTYYINSDYNASVDQRAKNILLRTWDGKIWYLTYYDGDTQNGKRNDCFLAYAYTIDRDTWDSEASKYAFEGRDSWLWNLVLANLQDDLKRCATNYRAKMTVERVLSMYTEEQMGNWSDRAYNKSGYLKYIRPAMVETYGKTWPFIYALQGNNKAFLTYFVENRFALLDAKYGTSSFTSDNIDLYMARLKSDSADVLRITANEVYAFGYGTNNSTSIGSTGIIDGGETATLSILGAYTVNDPLRVYGASRMRILDMTGAANHLKNGLDLGKCTVLRELNLQSSTTGSTGWWLSLSSCKQLRVVNLRNQSQAKTGSSTSTELDFSNQTRLEELDARGTSVQSVTFAKGAPLTSVKLPSTLSALKLEYLSKLTSDNLTLEGYSNVKTLVVDNCPGINWEALYAKCVNLERLRITGINREDDGTWLKSFLTKGGIDEDGNAVETCSLVGNVQLTQYLDDAEYQTLKDHFPELNIEQPEYTMLESDTSVSDDANISNLDNNTGYKYGNDYAVSGHIQKILSRRHRVLAKVTKKPTSQSINIAGQDTTMNNLDGEMTYYDLDDKDSYKYSDGSAAKLDGSEGDWMMLEPGYWMKGVNDYLNNKNYSCYSSRTYDNMPKKPIVDVLTLENIKSGTDDYMSGKKLMSGKTTILSSYSTDSSYSVCRVKVSGYKKVRFPSVPGTNLIGAAFADEDGNVLENIVVSSLGCKFEAGMYLIKDIPETATYLYFTILNTAEFDMVVLSNSSKIEDMEPDWVWQDDFLCAVVGSSIVGTKLRSCITGGSTAANMAWTDFHYYSVARGMQQIDPLMHSHIANLSYAKYGRRDMQEQCGAGSHTNARTTGGTAKYGMQDTIGYQEAYSINSSVTNSLVENLVHQYAWYKQTSGSTSTVVQVNNTCCLGYEDIYGHKYDMMDRVDMPNTSGNTYKWRIWMPDGTIRWVKGTSTSGYYITAVAHGKYMDVIPVGTVSGSSSTYYADLYWVSSSSFRVVYRGYGDADAYGGVSYAYASSVATYAGANVGSRLAFRGKIVKAESVEAYKALSEVA